ncbi:hypothetical protein DTO271G3_6101 [Paecilomyces variotii]|nr:hypothetical protein DTO271G3_6101 [Paecilomyces variotii]
MDQNRANDENGSHAPPRDPRIRQITLKIGAAKGQSHNEPSAVISPATTDQATGPSKDQSVSEAPGTPSNEAFARSFSGLAENIIALSQSAAEQANLKKRLEATEGSFTKTKNHFNFPSIVSYLQQLRRDDNDDLGRVEEKLRENKLRRDELERSVGSLVSSSTSHRHDSEIEIKLRDARTEAASAKNSALEAQLIASNAHKELETLKGRKETDKALEERLQYLQSRIDILDAATKAHSSSLSRLTKDIQECRNQSASTYEALARKTDMEVTEERSSSLHEKIRDMEQNLTSIESRLRSISSGQDDQRYIKEEIHWLKTAGEAHKAALENIPKLEEQLSALHNSSDTSSTIQKLDSVMDLTNHTRSQLDDISKRLSSLENASSANDNATSRKDNDNLKEEIKTLSEAFKELQSQIQQLGQAQGQQPAPTSTRDRDGIDLRNTVDQLSQQLSALQNVLEAKDDLQFQEMESLGKRLDEHSNVLEKLKGDQRVHETVSELSASLQSLARDIEKRQTIADVGLRSLEERYNNLSTETLAKNIITVIEEFYPLSLPALMEQLGFLKTQMDQLKALNTATQPAQLERMGQRLTALEGHYEKNQGTLKLSNNQMTQKIETLNYQQSALWAQMQNEVLPNIHEMKPLRDQLQSLTSRLYEHTEKVQHDITNREMERQSFLRDMKQERDRLNDEIKSVDDSVKDLAKKIKGLDNKVRETNGVTVTSLLSRIHESEKATTEEIKALARQFEETAQSAKREISDAVGRLEALEKVKEELASLPFDRLAEIGLGQPKMDTQPRDEHRKRRKPTAPSDEERSSSIPTSVSEVNSSSKSSPSLETEPSSGRKKKKRKRRQIEEATVNSGSG